MVLHGECYCQTLFRLLVYPVIYKTVHNIEAAKTYCPDNMPTRLYIHNFLKQFNYLRKQNKTARWYISNQLNSVYGYFVLCAGPSLKKFESGRGKWRGGERGT